MRARCLDLGFHFKYSLHDISVFILLDFKWVAKIYLDRKHSRPFYFVLFFCSIKVILVTIWSWDSQLQYLDFLRPQKNYVPYSDISSSFFGQTRTLNVHRSINVVVALSSVLEKVFSVQPKLRVFFLYFIQMGIRTKPHFHIAAVRQDCRLHWNMHNLYNNALLTDVLRR